MKRRRVWQCVSLHIVEGAVSGLLSAAGCMCATAAAWWQLGGGGGSAAVAAVAQRNSMKAVAAEAAVYSHLVYYQSVFNRPNFSSLGFSVTRCRYEDIIQILNNIPTMNKALVNSPSNVSQSLN
jgi:hypothetical protein